MFGPVFGGFWKPRVIGDTPSFCSLFFHESNVLGEGNSGVGSASSSVANDAAASGGPPLELSQEASFLLLSFHLSPMPVLLIPLIFP